MRMCVLTGSNTVCGFFAFQVLQLLFQFRIKNTKWSCLHCGASQRDTGFLFSSLLGLPAWGMNDTCDSLVLPVSAEKGQR